MIAKSHLFQLSLTLIVVLSLGGCSGMWVDHSRYEGYREFPRSVFGIYRENEMQRTWRGQKYDALLNALNGSEYHLFPYIYKKTNFGIVRIGPDTEFPTPP